MLNNDLEKIINWLFENFFPQSFQLFGMKLETKQPQKRKTTAKLPALLKYADVQSGNDDIVHKTIPPRAELHILQSEDLKSYDIRS